MTWTLDGTNDNISMGSNASVDSFASKSALAYFSLPSPGLGQTDELICKSDGGGVMPTGWQFQYAIAAAGDTGHIVFQEDFSTSDGSWTSANNSVANGSTYALAVTYANGATANNPVVYSNASSLALTRVAPVGTANGDAAQNLKIGENDGGTGDLQADTAWFVYDNTILTAADVNRHRWWGMAPGGPSTVDVWIPMWTDDLKNKGTAGSVADGTATGAVAGSMGGLNTLWPRGVRPGCGGM